MRRIATGNSGADSSAGTVSESNGSSSWLKGHKCIVSLAVIMILAFALRLVFSYGISAGSNYALSGGTDASSHLRIVLEILAGTYNPASQPQMNFPYGIESVSGPFYDYLMAGIAYIVTLFGVSNATAASGVMAWTAPIFGVLTAIPVFMVAKKLTDDETISIVAALLYVFSALVISVSPFSYGAEYALLGLLSAFMVYFIVRAIKIADEKNLKGFMGALDRDVFLSSVVAGLLFGLVAQTWVGFRCIVIVAAVILAIHVIISRISGRDVGTSIGMAVIFLLMGTFLAAAYYVPFGLWNAVFSGGCTLALLTAAFAVAFLLVEKKPWVITIPVFIVAIIVVAALIAVLLPDLSDAILHGNTAYEAGLVSQMVSTFSRSSISSMATWFGWLTVWMPLVVGGYMLFRYRRDGGKRLYDFTALWLLAMFFVAWFSGEFAILAATAMSVGAAILIVKVFRDVDMMEYLRSLKTLRGSGAKGAAKKVFNFFPFVTLVVAAVLIVAPNAVNAFDASTPTNDEHAGYFGGMGYSINTSDASLINSTWNHYGNESKDGALLSWYGYSDSAAVFGGFDTVTSSHGDGSSAMSVALLQNGSTGALVSMIVRVLQAQPEKVAAAVSGAATVHTINAAELKSAITDPLKAQALIDDVHADDYAKLNLDDSLRFYYGAYSYLVDFCALDDADLCTLYDSACNVTGKKIGYIEVDTSALPLYYGDSSYLSTLAYLGGYNIDGNGAATDFYTVYNYTGYNYAIYKDAMYNTLVYQATIGVTPAQTGSGSSISLLSDLSVSDGTVKATPGVGLTGFAVDYWHVMYNKDSKATGSSDGWTDMDAKEAIALQKTEGGLINYLASVVVLKYVGIDGTTTDTISGTIMAGPVALSHATVNSYIVDADGVRTMFATTTSDSNGKYSVPVPVDSDCVVVYSTSASGVRTDGNVFQTNTYAAGTTPDHVDVAVTLSNVSGSLVDASKKLYNLDGYFTLTTTSGVKTTTEYDLTGGLFTVTGIAPGTYTASAYDRAADRGAPVATGTLVVAPGTTEGVTVTVTTKAMTVTVTDQYTSKPVGSVDVVFVNTATGSTVATVTTDEKGEAVANVVPGTYSCYVDSANYVSVSTATKAVSKDPVSMSLTAYPARAVALTGAPAGVPVTVVAQGYRTVTTSASAIVPVTLDVASTYYAYAVDAGTLYAGSGNYDTGIALSSVDSAKITGVVKNADGKAVSKAVVAFDSVDWYSSTVTDSEGRYSITVPKVAGTLVVTDSANFAYGNVDGISADVNKDFDLAAGVSSYLSFYFYTGLSSGASKNLAFVGNISASFEKDGSTVTLYHLMTDSTGQAKVPVPKTDSGVTVKFTVAESESALVYIGNADTTEKTVVRDITGNGTFYIQRTAPSSASTSYGTSHIKEITSVPALGTYTGQLTCVSDTSVKYKVENGVVDTGSGKFAPGQYTFKTGSWSGTDFTAGIDSNGYYYDDDVYIRIGEVAFSWEEEQAPFKAFKVDVTGAASDDTVTVTCDDDSAVYKTAKTKETYYCETGKTFRFTATAADGKMAVKEVTAAGTVDFATKTAVVTVKGDVDAPKAEGTLTLTDSAGLTFKATVKDGAYSVKVPVGTTYTFSIATGDKVTYDDKENVYTYVISGTPSVDVPADATKDVTYNLGALTDSVDASECDVAITAASVAADGTASVILSMKYTGDMDKVTYIVKGSAGLLLDETYSRIVANGATETLIVDGKVPSVYGAGSSDVAVVITTAEGTEVATLTVPADSFAPVAGGKVTLALHDAEKVADAVNGYSYRYAFNVTNDNAYAVQVTLDAAFSGTPAGWTLFVADKDGNIVQNVNTALTVNGKTTESVYVVALCDKGVEFASIPAITYTASAKDFASNAVTIEGASVTGSLEKGSVEVDQSSASATKGGASDEGQKISNTFYGLVIVVVILLLVFLWAASKRGVFSRN